MTVTAPKYAVLCNKEMCAHFRKEPDYMGRVEGKTGTCAVYPDGIPYELYNGQVPPHLKPYPGDGGKLFKPKMELPQEYLDNLLEPRY